MIDPFLTKATLAGVSLSGVFAGLIAMFPEHTALVLLSGFCGGVVRALRAHDQGAWQRANIILTGSIVAVFLWPVGGNTLTQVFGALSLDEQTTVMTGGFTAGLLGAWLIDAIISFTRREEGE